MKPKLKLLLLPYIIISISLLVIYCFTCWLVFIKYHKIDPDEELINYWIPILLPWIPVAIWIRPQVKKLKLNRTGRRSPDFGYMMVAAFGITIPIIVTMTYIESASGKLSALQNVDEIKSHPLTKFYSFKHYYVDKIDKTIEFASHVSGKYNDHLNLEIYIACPLYDSDVYPRVIDTSVNTSVPATTDSITSRDIFNKKDPLIILDGKIISKNQLSYISPISISSINVLKGKSAIALYGEQAEDGVLILQSKKSSPKEPVAWLGIHYGKEISNTSSDNTKKYNEEEFYNGSMEDFKLLYTEHYSYFDRIGNTDHRRYFRAAIAKNTSGNNSSSAIILEPKTGDFNTRTGSELYWIFGSFAIATVIWSLMVLIPKINLTDHDDKLSQRQLSASEFKNAIQFFIPRKDFFVTPILIDINIITFLLMVFSGLGFIFFNNNKLIEWGANYAPLVIDGQWWRLITSTFIHGGFIHLLSNMIALLFIGIILEPVIGKKIFAITYFIAGLAGSISSFCWNDAVISVGASGAIFGLYGIFLALMFTKYISKDISKAFLGGTIFFIVYNLIMGFAGTGVDNMAHLGGLISGALTGFAYTSFIDKKDVD